MSANGYIVEFRRGATASALEPTRDVVECDWSASSHPGCERSHNEDAWHVAPDAGVFVLADGMGGYNAGDVASQLAVERVANGLVREVDSDGYESLSVDTSVRRSLAAVDAPSRSSVLDREINAANAAILAAAARRPECLGMATTLACLWVDQRQFCVAHLGNSRVYLLRGTRFTRLTRDHAVGKSLAGIGRDEALDTPHAADRAEQRPCAAVLTRVLGVEPVVDVEVRQVDWFHGDRLLLCSDGLTSSISDAQIADVMQGATSASECVDTLIAAALAAGCRDNVTAVGVFLSRSFKPA